MTETPIAPPATGPISRERVSPSPQPPKAAAPNHTVLLVDDDPSVLRALGRCFHGEGHTILTAGNASEALSALATHPVELVISDYSMPGMTGVDFLRIVREKYPQTVRLMLTGATEGKVFQGAVQEGAVYKFIAKPWDDDDLRVTVQLALRQLDLTRENVRLKETAQRQSRELGKLKRYFGAGQSTLGSVLVARGMLMPGQWEMVEKYSRQREVPLVQALVELGMADEQDLLRVLQDESHADFAEPADTAIDRCLAQLLPREICQGGCLVPLRREGKTLHLAMADPLDLARIDHISFTTQANIVPHLARAADIQRAIAQLYAEAEAAAPPQDLSGGWPEEIDVLLDTDQEETVEQLVAKSATPTAVNIVNTIIAEAIRRGASDIHVEPKATHSEVRYRVDGLLESGITIPAELRLATVSRLKILARMDIAERRVPQDGRITVKAGTRTIDIRASSMPTINGEKIVCRLLDKSASVWSLDKLGIDGALLARLKNIISIPQGMVIATGPTGSGKTTSLYSIMQERLSPTLNFVTIEDPVEYFLENASQVHVRERIGLTFASTLRATLRQDPDVILVGEIRDLETGMAAFQAAMTGHMVFTTLHTNSTIATISRLFHLGVEPYLVASAVQGIIAQRLVRKVCSFCREQREYDSHLPETLGIDRKDLPAKLYYGSGCAACGQTGFKGRIGLFEVFQMNEEFRQYLTTSYREVELLSMARTMGMKTLLEDGVAKVVTGLTTLEELVRILGPAARYDYACRSCGAALDIKFSTCPYCGVVQRRVCGNCRVRLDPEWIACPYCGTREITVQAKES